jgi:3-hydroxyisobutyrate dehydrogenase-like beta-hydroxyacid dehydrogenase
MAEMSGGAARAVAVIGAGIMGSAMARNLVAAGFDTRVWDRSASATGPLADAGAVVAASAREAVKNAAVTALVGATALAFVVWIGAANHSGLTVPLVAVDAPEHLRTFTDVAT